MADAGLEDELAAVDDRVNAMMDEKIREYVAEVVEERFETGVRAARSHELETELVNSLRKIANRIDHGYNFDVRAPEPDEPEGAENPDSEIDQATQRIVAASPNLKYINRTGQSVLSLPEGNGSADDVAP